MKKQERIPPQPSALYRATPGETGHSDGWARGRDQHLPIWPENASFYHCTEGWECVHDNPSQHFFEMLLAGTLRIEIENEIFNLNPGEIILLPAGVPNRLAVPGKFCRKRAIGICGLLADLTITELFGEQRPFIFPLPAHAENTIR